MQEELAEAAEEIPFISKRNEKLSKAIEEAESEEAYDEGIKALKSFRKKMGKITDMVDLTIVAVIKKWDLCLTQEDENDGITIPLEKATIKTLPDVLRYDLFSKIMEAVRTRTEQEKKDLSVISQNGSPILTGLKDASPLSTRDISLPSDTANGQMQFENGVLTSSTRHS